MTRGRLIELIIMVALLSGGLLWAFLYSPGGRQRILLREAAAWQERQGQELERLLSRYPGVELVTSTACESFLVGEVREPWEREEIHAAVLTLGHPLPITNQIKVVGDKLRRSGGAGVSGDSEAAATARDK